MMGRRPLFLVSAPWTAPDKRAPVISAILQAIVFVILQGEIGKK